MADESVYSIPIDTGGLDSFKKGIGEVGKNVTGILNSWKQSSKQMNDLKTGQKGFTQTLEGSVNAAKRLNDEVARHATLVKATVGHWNQITTQINAAVDAAKRLNVETGRRPPSAGTYVETGRGPVPEPEGRRRPPPEDKPEKKKTDAGFAEAVDGLLKVSKTMGKSMLAMGGEGAGVVGEAASALKGLSKMNIPAMIATGVAAAITAPALAAFATAPDVAALKKGRMALGGGIDAGTMRAMRATGSWLPGSGLDTLGNVVSAQRNQVGPEAQAFYQLMGVNKGKQLLAGPASTAMFEYLKEAGRVQRAAGPGMQDAIAQRYGMTRVASMGQLRTADALGPEGVAGYQRTFDENRRKMAMAPEAEENLAGLADKMKISGELMEVGIAKNVAFLGPKLGDMAEGVANFVDHDYAGKLGGVLESLTSNFSKLNQVLGGKAPDDKSGTIDFNDQSGRGSWFGFGRGKKKPNPADLPSPDATPDAFMQTTGGGWAIPGQGGGSLKGLGSRVGGLLSGNPMASAVGATGNALLAVKYGAQIAGAGAAGVGAGILAAPAMTGPMTSGGMGAAIANDNAERNKFWSFVQGIKSMLVGSQSTLEESKKQTTLLTDIKSNLDHASKFGGVGLGDDGGAEGGGGAPMGIRRRGRSYGGNFAGSGRFLSGRHGAGGPGAPAGIRARSRSYGGSASYGGEGGSVGGGGKYNTKATYDLIKAAGGTDEEAHTLAAISQAESSGNQMSHNTNARTGDNSYGLWQINMLNKLGPERRKHYGLKSNEDLFDPATNARVALQMHRESRGHGYGDWTTYSSGKYRKYLGGEKGPSSVASGVSAAAPGTGNAAPVSAGPDANAALPTELTRQGKMPDAFIAHHTAGRSAPGAVVADWAAHRPGIGAQYIMDRKGVIHDTKKEYGYGGTGQILPGVVGGKQYSNANTVGMEIVAKDDKDVTAQQTKAFAAFIRTHYPNTPILGHGQVNPGHREETEGMSARKAVEADRAAVRAAASAPKPPAGVANTAAHARSFHQTGGMQTASNQPLGLHNWQQNRSTAFTLHNKTGGDMFVGASLMA